MNLNKFVDCFLMKENEVKLSSSNLENTSSKRKKRQRTSTVSETEEKDSRLQYERGNENFQSLILSLKKTYLLNAKFQITQKVLLKCCQKNWMRRLTSKF